MSSLPVIENPISTPQETAIVEIEENLIGWQLKGAPGVQEVVVSELRSEAAYFQPPYNRVQQAILREVDAGRTVSAKSIYAVLQENPALAEIGGAELLWTMAHASPAVVSVQDGRKQAAAAIRTWRRLQTPLPQYGEVELVRADAVTPTKIDWIWPGWLASGKFHLIAGSPGTGKTTLSLSLAAAVTSGGPFPCGWQASRGSVLFWSGEDDLADSIVPRFLACGGDGSKLHFVGGVRDNTGGTIPFDPANDMDRLVAAARGLKDLKLLVVDPVVSAVTGDSHKNSETRRGLQPLVDFAAQAGAAVLGITHYSKGTAGRDPAERVTGSLAFVAVSRVVMATAKPKQAGDSWRMVRAKSNIGPDGGGFEYDLQRISINGDQEIEGQCVVWGDSLDGTAQALLAEVESPEIEPEAPSREAAEHWLVNILGTGSVRASYIESTAQEAGVSLKTLRRAKKHLGVESINAGRDGWLWSMPKMATPKLDGHLKNRGHVATWPDGHPNCVATLGDHVAMSPEKGIGL